MTKTFTLKRARSGSLTFVLSLVIVVETVAIHLLLVSRLPAVAWLLSAASVASLVWLWRDYRALASSAIMVHADRIELRIGRRLTADVPRDRVANVSIPSWRDAKPGRDARYVDATAPATANVRITFTEPVEVHLLGLIRRSVGCLGLRIDDPNDFTTTLNS